MGRFYGAIGFNEGTTETSPGVWTEAIIERNYYGDVIKNTRRLQEGNQKFSSSDSGINDNITINNSISVVADPYAYQNFHAIRYVQWMGSLWKVTNVEVQRPRLILTIGGVYNIH